MSKFSQAHTRPNTTAPIRSVSDLPDTLTYEGGAGFSRDSKSELFLLAVSNMVGEDTFYEGKDDRDIRYRALVRQVATEDPDWIRRFVPYLRNTMNMRSASVVMAAEYAATKAPNARYVISSACQRADEPAELLAYWFAQYGRKIPSRVKRGLADAVTRLYTERAALRYDPQGHAWRMADVIDLVHPTPSDTWQSELFRYLLDKRHNRAEVHVGNNLTRIRQALDLEALPVESRRAKLSEPAGLAEAGFSWERLSGWLQGPMDAAAWEAIIPSMGYMALLRNLRNFDEAGVSTAVKNSVATILADPDNVKKSRQFPIRFYSAWKATQTLTWGAALEVALQYSLANVPALPGNTLIMVDCSRSMDQPLSAKSTISLREAAAVFGSALALRCEKADLIAYGTDALRVHYKRHASVLRLMPAFTNMGGTRTWDVLRVTYQKHDRVILITDEQAFLPADSVWDPARGAVDIPLLYIFNLAGYRQGHAPSGERGRYTFGGLSDAAFTMLPLLEKWRSADWPF